MGEQEKKWFMQKGVRVPDHVIPGQPRREVAQEFFTNVLELGEHARKQYLEECKAGTRAFDQAEINHLDEQLNIIRAELAKVK